MAISRAFKRLFEGDVEGALADATLASDVGNRFGNRDLESLALNARARCLIAVGRVDEGLAMLDEAAAAAVTGELEPFTAGGVYCATIGACAALGDWGRAAQWTEAQDRWCKREQINGFPGMCRLHRAEIKLVRGAWMEAEAEARRAAEELASFLPAAVSAALYSIGEIRLRRGDLAGAEEILLRSHAMGREPEPALSLLRLAEGRADAALASIRLALDNPARNSAWAWAPPDTPWSRIALLPAYVEIALAAGDGAAARAGADELTELSTSYSSVSVQASAAHARAAVELAEGRPAEARSSARSALRLWTDLDAPYESARCRVLLAETHVAGGDRDSAVLELRAARELFATLGAVPDVKRTDQALARLDAPAGAGTEVSKGSRRVRRTFVFTDVVDSTRLLELVGDDRWEDLSRWHDETVRSLIAQHGGEEVKTIGDGFFVAFARLPEAVAFAVALQRALVAHRRTTGFALEVRVGIHQAEASHRGRDYSGQGRERGGANRRAGEWRRGPRERDEPGGVRGARGVRRLGAAHGSSEGHLGAHPGRRSRLALRRFIRPTRTPDRACAEGSQPS
jgi:class 3 adenylate cyclase